MGVARPIAAGVNRLRVGPSLTTAYLTRSWSTSSAVFSRSARCSAFATADLSTLWRSEEHTSELQSRLHLVCRLLLEKKKRPTQAYGRWLPATITQSVGRRARAAAEWDR